MSDHSCMVRTIVSFWEIWANPGPGWARFSSSLLIVPGARPVPRQTSGAYLPPETQKCALPGLGSDHRAARKASTSADAARLAFVYEAMSTVGTTLDLERQARQLAGLAVPGFADFASVHLFHQMVAGDEDPAPQELDGAVVMHRVAAVLHEDLHCGEELPPGKMFVYKAGTAMARFLAAIQPVLIPHVDEDVVQCLPAELDGPAARAVLKGSAVMLVPLVAHGMALGFVVFGRQGNRPAFAAADLTACEEMAGRAALSLHNARIHSNETAASSVLQRSLLPTPPPRLPGVEIAYRYHSASHTTRVGGDWLDVMPLPRRRVGLVIGDVAGHGLHAAVVMGQLRTAVRALATLDLNPGRLLAQLDAFAQHLGHPRLATCLYCVYDPTTGLSAFASAGHLPPVLVGPDGSSDLLKVPVGAPIGVGSVTFDTLELRTAPGSLLLLCTDGLVETRGQDIEEALRGLGHSLTAQHSSLEDSCEALLRHRHPDGHHDDITLLMARLNGIPGDLAGPACV